MKLPAILLTLFALINTAEVHSQNQRNQIKTIRDSVNVTDTSKSVFTIVEEMPVYPGGISALTEYIKSNLKYPESAKRDSIQGKVFVNFVVNEEGFVTNVKVLRGLSDDINKEAIRIVSSMPQWIPGTQDGKPVRVAYNLPLIFKLNQR